MTEQEEHLRHRIALLTDESLLQMAGGDLTEYTPEAAQSINDEVARRGGLEDLKRKVELERERAARSPEAAGEASRRLAVIKKWYPLFVTLAYSLFMYAINASLWLYWLLLFALIAWLLAILFKPPFKPQDEIKELLEKAKADTATQPTDKDSEGQLPE